MADRWIRRWAVAGSDNRTYIVAQDREGNFGCDCPKWKFQKNRPRIDCQHITRRRSVLASASDPLRTITGRMQSSAPNIQELSKRVHMNFSAVERRMLAEQALQMGVPPEIVGVDDWTEETPIKKKKVEIKKPVRAIELED